MKPLMSLILLLSLTTLVSCGQQGKTSAKLEVSQNFIVDSNKFGGGLIITGESSNGKKFTLALDDSRGGSVELDQGNWTFTAVAWDGDNNNLKFEGTTYCGMSQANLNSAEADVSISVSSANCNGAGFSAKAPIKKIKTLACGMFYSYNLSTNAFTPVTATAPDNFCEASASAIATAGTTSSRVPDEYMNQYLAYRVISSHGINGAVNAGFESECKGVANEPLSLPSKSVPFFIRLYKTNSDCTNKLVNTPVYHFPNGLEAGNPSKFDHDFHDINTATTTAPLARLVLPTSITKRGRSPFMGMIPRILCGNSGSFTDCLPDPTLTQEDVFVPFYNDGDGRDQLILRDVPANATCPTSLLPNMRFFSASECKIEDGNAFAKFHRNELTCQQGQEFNTALDIYQANGNFYILKLVSGGSEIHIFDATGRFVNKVTYSGTLKNIAVDSSENIYGHTSTSLVKFSYYSQAQAYDSPTTTPTSFTQILNIEVTPDGSTLFVAANYHSYPTNYTKILAYPTSLLTTTTLTTIPATAVALTNGDSVPQMQYIPGDLTFASGTSSPTLKKVPWSTSFGTMIPVLSSPAGIFSYYIENGDYFYVLSSSIERRDSTQATKSLGTVGFSGPAAVTARNGFMYTILGTSGLKVYDTPGTNASPGTANTITANNNTCAEPSTNTMVTIGGKTKTLQIHANADDAVYRIWETGFEMIGRRNVTTSNARYYFHELNPHGDEISNGGYLRRPQQMLSPNGIAGFFSDFATCQELATAVAAAGSNGIVRSQTLFDAFTGEFQTYGVTAKQNVDPLDTYLCEDSAVLASCPSSNTFSMELRFGALNTTEVDDSVLKISCDRKLGTMESLEFKNDELRRELIKWNTGSDTASRFEVYYLSRESSEDRASITKLQKVTDDKSFISRQVSASHRVGEVYANIKEYHKIFSATDHEFRFLQAHLKDTSVENFKNDTHSGVSVFPSGDFDTVKVRDDFSSYAPGACLDVATTSTQASSTCATGTMMSRPPLSAMSEGSTFDLTAIDLIDFTSETHPFQDGSVFEISGD